MGFIEEIGQWFLQIFYPTASTWSLSEIKERFKIVAEELEFLNKEKKEPIQQLSFDKVRDAVQNLWLAFKNFPENETEEEVEYNQIQEMIGKSSSESAEKSDEMARYKVIKETADYQAKVLNAKLSDVRIKIGALELVDQARAKEVRNLLTPLMRGIEKKCNKNFDL